MTEICPSSDLLEGTSKGFKNAAGSIFLTRKHGLVYAYANVCPHLGIPLEWQQDQFLSPDNELIQCASHGAQFIIESGVCVSGPCVNQKLTPVDVSEENGFIFLRNL